VVGWGRGAGWDTLTNTKDWDGIGGVGGCWGDEFDREGAKGEGILVKGAGAKGRIDHKGQHCF
jgi:hypothetical protein